MTISELQAKRDEVLKRLGIVQERYGERSVQYGDAKGALALLDAEIGRLQAAQAGVSTPKTSYATFSNR